MESFLVLSWKRGGGGGGGLSILEMEEVSCLSSGRSHRVQNVQALAGDGSSGVPPRYIRPEAAVDPVIHDGDVELPIIDLSRLMDPRFLNEESAKLKYACEEWGFFQLINHGVGEEVIEGMKADAMKFFELPLEQKEAFVQEAGNLEGYGQAFVVSEKQKLDWADMLYLVTRPLPKRSMRFWPTQPSTFRAKLDNYSSELTKVASYLHHLMAKNLGLDPATFLDNFKDGVQGVRINYYPPCSKVDKVLGISPHTDATTLTLLLQVSDVQGLQIKKNGSWFPIEPLPRAFIVNIGDIFEIWSNGKYKSIEHRAIVDNKKERLSIAAFHGPSVDSMVGPFPELVKGDKKHYKEISFAGYKKKYFSAKLEGKSLLKSMMIE